MAQAWADRSAAARETFEEADDALGMDLTRLCWEGPASELQLTAITQPAILTTSVAIYRAVPELAGWARMAAGHSLGEYSALVAAGSLRFADAVRLVHQRGRLMQQAVPVGQGAMAALLGIDAAQVAEIVDEAAGDEVCAVANYNSLQQTVIAGHLHAVERAVTLATERGARRSVLLPVSAPFHSPLMAPARAALEPLLRETRFDDPGVPVVANVSALPLTTGGDCREALVGQVDGPVRWVETIQWMVAEGGIDIFVEVGPGSVLRGLVRRIVKGVGTHSLAEPDTLQELSDALAEGAG
jgi:[acyl-carrier-protein] S-malonyltransferase